MIQLTYLSPSDSSFSFFSSLGFKISSNGRVVCNKWESSDLCYLSLSNDCLKKTLIKNLQSFTFKMKNVQHNITLDSTLRSLELLLFFFLAGAVVDAYSAFIKPDESETPK